MNTTALSRRACIAYQLGIVLAFLAAWQFVPQIPGLSQQLVLFDPFFISSPASRR